MTAADKLPERRRTLRTAEDLVRDGLLPADQAEAAARAAETLPIAIPPTLRDLLSPGDADDPLTRQFVPSAAELAATAEELADPIGDEAHAPIKGVVHRYPDRVLLKPLLVCPVYCRFCFRREAVGPDGGALSPAETDAAIAYVAERAAVREVILTGGEPLMLPPPRLGELLARLGAIAHVETLRVHTRIPVAEPERVGPALVAALRGAGAPVFVVVHCNHARELAEPACRALALLADGGIPLLAQTVLLKGVNADAAVLEDLMRALIRNRVKPYYLHHPDLVRGTSHFRPTLAEGQDIVRRLRARLPGIAMPAYVVDIPGGHGKIPAAAAQVDAAAGWTEDRAGVRRPYG